MEQKFDAALPYERREKLRASRRRQWCQPFLKFPSVREHFRLLPTRAEDESRGLPRPFPTLCAHVTYPVRKGSWECATLLPVHGVAPSCPRTGGVRSGFRSVSRLFVRFNRFRGSTGDCA
ncbi:hypothetical protein Bbelb_075600 [Branchiostoma belcheri]|nr:hypothetical protein Bbelb_075600 [Branchiostoma belcheri]